MTSGSAEVDTGKLRRPVFAIERVIGASHRRSGKPCQDEVGAWTVAGALAVAVADGHGTSKYADVGARLAVHVALSALVRFSEDLGERSTNLPEVQKYAEHPLRVQIVREWAARVRARAGDEEVPLVDYGSTLIFALATPEFLLVGQIGDGDVLLVDEAGSVSAPLPADPDAFADETPSLCQPEAWHSLRIRTLPAPSGEALLLLSTDGYSKSYATDDDFKRIGPDYLDLVREGGLPSLAPHLPGFLEQVTTQGSGDDIAFAVVHWPPTAADGKGEDALPVSSTDPHADPALEVASEGSDPSDCGVPEQTTSDQERRPVEDQEPETQSPETGSPPADRDWVPRPENTSGGRPEDGGALNSENGATSRDVGEKNDAGIPENR